MQMWDGGEKGEELLMASTKRNRRKQSTLKDELGMRLTHILFMIRILLFTTTPVVFNVFKQCNNVRNIVDIGCK